MHSILPLQVVAWHAGTAVLFYIFKVAAQFKINKTGHVFNKFACVFAAVFGFKGFIVSVRITSSFLMLKGRLYTAALNIKI